MAAIPFSKNTEKTGTMEIDQKSATNTSTDIGTGEQPTLTPEGVFRERPSGAHAAISIKTSSGFEGFVIQNEKEPQSHYVSDKSTSAKATFTDTVVFVRINHRQNPGNNGAKAGCEVTVHTKDGRAYFKSNGDMSGSASVGEDKTWSKWFWNKLSLKY